MNIRPIMNDEDHARALGEVEALWGAAEGSIEYAELDALATLIDAYERKRWPIEGSDPIEVLTQALAEGRSQTELGVVLGSQSRASEILNRRRALTIEMIDKISNAWGIPRQLLAVPYALERPAESVP